MRLYSYVNEDFKDESEYISDVITEDCAPFLKEFGNKRIYRGVKRYVSDIKRITPRKNRKPKDVSLEVHKLCDNILNSIFGWKARSEGVFVTRDKLTAQGYGSMYLFFPIGEYKYIWSRYIADMWSLEIPILKTILLKKMKDKNIIPEEEYNELIKEFIKIERNKEVYKAKISSTILKYKYFTIEEISKKIKEYKKDVDEIEPIVKQLFKNIYLKDNIDISVKNEIMFKCDEYYLINPKYERYI